MSKPETGLPSVPRIKRIERQGVSTAPMVHHYPPIRGGLCDWCGVIDPQFKGPQYQLCPHYRGQHIACSYCDSSRSQEELTKRTVFSVTDSPFNSEEMVVCCDNYECVKKHRARFDRSA